MTPFEMAKLHLLSGGHTRPWSEIEYKNLLDTDTIRSFHTKNGFLIGRVIDRVRGRGRVIVLVRVIVRDSVMCSVVVNDIGRVRIIVRDVVRASVPGRFWFAVLLLFVFVFVFVM